MNAAEIERRATQAEIVAALRDEYCAPKWLTVPELANSTGSRADRRIDLFALAAWPSGGFETIAFEIKVSRGDFFRDIRDPLKQRHARLYCSQFYFVTPADLVQPAEIPDWAGLRELHKGAPVSGPALEWMKAPYFPDNFKTVVMAPDLPRIHPTWPFVASLLRTSQKFTNAGPQN